jgi:hypothetical protein
MKLQLRVLEAFAHRYERSQAGRTGKVGRDMLVNIEDLLRDVGAVEGEWWEAAIQQLQAAEKMGILKLEPLDKRAPSSLHQIRFSPVNEEKLYDGIGRDSPKSVREMLAKQFAAAAALEVPEQWRESWRAWCQRFSAAALAGNSVDPFRRFPSDENRKLLALLPQLFAWEGESLVRFVSCNLCGHSKELELLAAKDKDGEFQDKLRGKLGRLLADITGGKIQFLDDLGILPNPRFALVHGPLKLQLDGEWLDLGRLQGAFRLAESDIKRAENIVTAARRCLTIENETSFHELAKIQSNELLIQTSYPGSGTMKLLHRLPAEMEFWHFGDSDEAGFDILRVLQKKSGRNFQPLHMQPGRIPFEQESLGCPNLRCWPYYR